MKRALAFALLIAAAPAAAQDHAGHDMSMPGMAMPAPTPAPTAAIEPGMASPPPIPRDHYADRQYPKAEMDRAHRIMMAVNGDQSLSMIMLNLAEMRNTQGRDSYHWDGEAWFGGDIDRLTIKTEGEAAVGSNPESAEVQALYSRAIGPTFNLQAGGRYDLGPSPHRAYATIGIEGLAPYMFEVGAALFLSDKGDLLGRAEASYDQRVTQRLILQPRVELNLSAQDVPATRTGAGLSNAELGLRLRYEVAREFAPYIGIIREAKTGKTADYARAAGDRASSTSLVIGLRAWF